MNSAMNSTGSIARIEEVDGRISQISSSPDKRSISRLFIQIVACFSRMAKFLTVNNLSGVSFIKIHLAERVSDK